MNPSLLPYVEIIMPILPRYFIREKVLTAIRRFFFDRGFHEIETPYLTGSLPPESYLDVFETTLRRSDPSGQAFRPIIEKKIGSKLIKMVYGSGKNPTKNIATTSDEIFLYSASKRSLVII